MIEFETRLAQERIMTRLHMNSSCSSIQTSSDEWHWAKACDSVRRILIFYHLSVL